MPPPADPCFPAETVPTRTALGGDITMAFQPIVDPARRLVYAYEALVRGRRGEGALEVLNRVRPADRYSFDQACRVKAIALAARLGVTTRLDVNFLPNAVGRPDTCLRTTLRAARRLGFPADRLVFEATEGERVTDAPRVAAVVGECRRRGLRIAIDDFGAGYAGLNLLADLHPDVVKLDMGLCRGVDRSRTRQAIVHGVLTTCRDLGIEVVAEGVETADEYLTLRTLGVELFQGFLFARPGFEHLPDVTWPE